MSGSIVLLHLAGAVALLLYATRMIRTGVERAYGVALRQHLQGTRPRPALALLVGLALAMAMQSATAVSLLVSSFVSSGVLISTVGMMVVLGADLGSALMVTVLSHDLSVLAPVALVIGTVCFMHAERRGWRQTGRLAIGLGLLLLSLKMIGEASEPLRESPILPIIVSFLENDLMIACLLAALAAWLFHSSVAFVLFVVALAARDLVPLALGLAFVLGANLGGGMVAVLLSRTLPPAGQIVPLCNFLLRGALAFIHPFSRSTQRPVRGEHCHPGCACARPVQRIAPLSWGAAVGCDDPLHFVSDAPGLVPGHVAGSGALLDRTEGSAVCAGKCHTGVDRHLRAHQDHA